LLADYRDYHGTFDRIVSIEMIEAVGRKNIPGFFDMVRRCLKDRGLFALQAISAESFSYYSKPTFDQFILWLRKRIFPNGYLPTFSQLATSERKGLIVEDVENFGVDYATTLQAWSTNFQQGWLSGDLRLKYGDRFKRMWEYYLAGCEALFRARMVQLYQIVYSYNRAPEVSTR
jgi:cyclopropane-fatty-acyl-phospholipid synthase